MKMRFKQYGIAAAIAAASAGYVSTASGQTMAVANDASGDMALVPYYTVDNNFVTGLHITNTTNLTQVVKIRLRRGTDSLDALDWNVVLSPFDMYSGLISKNASDRVQFQTFDETSCTIPAVSNNTFVMPEVYDDGATNGYIEVIAMAAALDSQPISVAAKHVADADGKFVPRDCAAVRSNFLKDGTAASDPGNQDYDTTWQAPSTVTSIKLGGENAYIDSVDALKVSWFIRDEEGGIEMGDSAVHIENFLAEPAMTNQEKGQGIQSGDLSGFDFPDLNGGVPGDTGVGGAGGDRNKYGLLRGALATASISNEWSANPENDVLTNWVVTIPGQYTMLNMPSYVASLTNDLDCDRGTLTAGAYRTTAPALNADDDGYVQCDFRDLPVTATVTTYSRDEEMVEADDPLLDVSPSLPGAPNITRLTKESTVVTFGGRQIFAFEDGVDVNIDREFDQPYGWATLSLAPASGDKAVCEWTVDGATPTLAALVMQCDELQGPATAIPMIGFNAWVREVNGTSSKYGRAIGHTTLRTATP